jgi:predicted acetyltransferase
VGNQQKKLEYEAKMEIKTSELRLKEEIITMATDFDNKSESHKDYVQDHVEEVYNTISSDLEEQRSRTEV